VGGILKQIEKRFFPRYEPKHKVPFYQAVAQGFRTCSRGTYKTFGITTGLDDTADTGAPEGFFSPRAGIAVTGVPRSIATVSRLCPPVRTT